MKNLLLGNKSALFKALENNEGNVEIYVDDELCYTVLIDTKQLVKQGFQGAFKFDLVKEQQDNIVDLLEEEIMLWQSDTEE